MTEDKGKEEEKFDLSPELEGYINLDEARVLALQHARDNCEVYGRYAEIELVVEVIGAVQTKTSTRSHSLSYHPVTSRPWPGADGGRSVSCQWPSGVPLFVLRHQPANVLQLVVPVGAAAQCRPPARAAI